MRVVSSLVVGVIVFFLAGWFLMPHLPPTPSHPISAFELEFWMTNWAGVVVGAVVGVVNYRVSGKKAR